MPTHPASLETIEDFLAQKRIALVGISRAPASDSARLLEELGRRGYDVVPVNPHTSEVHGRHCFARVQEIQPPVDAVLLMTAPDVTEKIVSDCAEAGVRRLWMYRGAGKGSVSEKAVAFCQEHGMRVVPGQCPFMFLPDTAGIHRFHGFLRKIMGRYPQHSHAA
jgi:predicted CoA-binding protein